MSVLLLLSTFLSLFLSGLVFLKKNKKYSDYLLGYWFLFTAFHMFLLYIQYYNAEHDFPYPALIGIDISLIVVHPIWIFIYILSYIRPNTRSFKILWHLLPVVVVNLVLLKTYYLRSNAEKIESLKSAFQGTGYIDQEIELSAFIVISIAFAYLLASFWLLWRHRRNVKDHYSTIEGKDLKWLQILLYGIAVVIIVNTLLEWIRNYMDIFPPNLGNYIGLIFILIGISFVGIKGIRQTSVFVDYDSFISSKEHKEDHVHYDDNNNHKSSAHDSSDKDYEDLVKYMEHYKPFTDIDLNLFKLAELTDLRSRYLSQLINQKSGKNFFDFVNSYRIKEFKSRVRQPENKHYTLLSIAFDCGFNSKATFNRVFKNQTGYTPSEFFINPGLE